MASSLGAPPTPPVRAAAGQRAGSDTEGGMDEGGIDGDPLNEQELKELVVDEGTNSGARFQISGGRMLLLHQRLERARGLATASGRHQQDSMDWPSGLGEDVVNKAGAAVVEGCGAPFDKGNPENLRAMFRGERCVGAWDVSAGEVTSEEDDYGIVIPKKGEGRVGRGSPMMVTHNGGQAAND